MNINHALVEVQPHDTWDVGRVVVIFNETNNEGGDEVIMSYSEA